MDYEIYAVPGYTISDDGIWRQGGKEDRFISSMPILVTAKLWNDDSRTEKVELSFRRGTRWRRLIVPHSAIASKSNIVKLADSGVAVTSENAGELVRFLYAQETAMGERIPRKEAKSVMGWVEGTDTFMPYTDSISFDGEEQFGSLHRAIARKGKLEEWVKEMIPLRKNLALRLTMAASFASPLIEVIG